MENSESFTIGVRQGCVMSPWLFNVLYGWVYEKSESQWGYRCNCVRLKMNRMGWTVVACLFAGSEEELQRVVDELLCMYEKEAKSEC